MCLGSVNIINNLDDLVDKWNEKISLVRRHAGDGRQNTTRIETKYNSLNLPTHFDGIVFSSSKIKQKDNSKQTRKIKGIAVLIML